MKPTQTTRRRFLAVGGAAALFGLAGCTGDAKDGQGTGTTSDETSTTGAETSANTTNATTAERTVESEPTGTTDATGTETATESLTPHDTGSVHHHGFLTFEVNGERVDYDETRFFEKNTGNPNFHFHETKNDNLTHVHAKDLTVHYALNSLPGITVGKRSSVKLAGRTYTTADADTTMSITVNNELVDPRTYVLGEHDHIEVLIETSAEKAPPTVTNSTSATSTTNTTSATTAGNATGATDTTASDQ